MILETGRVVAIEPQGLWVETLQRSACGSCHAQKGCGHSILAKMGASASRVWVLLEGRDPDKFAIGSEVQIGIAEEVIARGSLFIYLIPVISLISATFAAHYYRLAEGPTAVLALVGLLTGAAIVRVRAYQTRFDARLQPVLVDAQTSVRLIQTCVSE